MEKAKDNKGITLIMLIVTIILLIIIVSVSTYTGIKTYKDAKVQKFIAEMQLVQAKVEELASIEEEFDDEKYSPTQYSSIINAASQEVVDTDVENYKYFSKESLKAQLDIDVDSDVLINFTTREVISIDGVKYKGQIYYTIYKLSEGQKVLQNTENIRSISGFTENSITTEYYGLNCELTIRSSIINGTLSYSEKDTNNWTTISNYTMANTNYHVSITKAGIYTFKLSENASNANETVDIKITTVNKPYIDENISGYNYSTDNINAWANSNGYIWIPRFAYKENNELSEYDIVFIKGNSNILTDNTYLTSDWNVPDIFDKDNEKLTGVWVDRHDINTLKDIITNTNLEGYKQIPDASRFEHEVFNQDGETEFSGTNKYFIAKDENNEQIRLFSADNVDRNFLISFNVVSVNDPGGKIEKNSAPTLIGSMDENSSGNKKNGKGFYPGFNVKLFTDPSDNKNKILVESNSYDKDDGDVYAPEDVRNIRILRLNRILYYSFDGKKFIKINDYSDPEKLNPFDAPVVFGAGLNSKGQPYRYFDGILSDISIKFIDDGVTIDNYNPVLKTIYAHEGEIQFVPSNKNPSQMIDVKTGQVIPNTELENGVSYIDGMIYTGLSMFKEDTLDKDFEISFVVKEIATKNEGQTEQAAIVNAKYEKKNTANDAKSWPGFVFRIASGYTTVELTARPTSVGSNITNTVASLTAGEGHKITISRRDRIVYFSIDDTGDTQAFNFTNFNLYFDVPITIGGSLNNEGAPENPNVPFRGFKGVLSNIVIKVDE